MEITAEQVANGMDRQGIPWEELPFSQEDYRETRLRNSENQESPDSDHDDSPQSTSDGQFFNFSLNDRSVDPSFFHHQLRNLAWATSEHNVFFMHKSSIMNWNAVTKEQTQVLDLTGSDTATTRGLSFVQISTMAVKDDLVIAGGFNGEVVAKNLNTDSIIHNSRITDNENAIINAIDISDRTVMASGNDCHLCCFDIDTFEKTSCFEFDNCLNHATRQPTGKLVVVAADENPIHIIDGDTGERVHQLHGHQQFSFATGWHPNEQIFATGSQDNTCRIWDIRNISESLHVLKTKMGAVRSLRFSSCGQFLAIAESQDYVHVFDVSRKEIHSHQEIDFFGEIAGIALTPSAESLYIAISDRTFHSLMRYERNRRTPSPTGTA